MRSVLRLAGYFLLVLALLAVLRQIPWVGGLFRGLLGFWIAVLLLSAFAARMSQLLLARRRLQAQIRVLEGVDSPHNRGKLGSLLLAHGRARAALPHLERAVAGEPETLEWRYRKGLALAQLGRVQEAERELAAVAALDEEYGYGSVQLQLSRLRLGAGDADGALAALDRFETNHGPNPESAYRRGLASRKLGRREEARESFRSVSKLARGAAHFQRQQNRGWVLRAMLARWV
jgi:tetratricopeptide (TPR) repeat protein